MSVYESFANFFMSNRLVTDVESICPMHGDQYRVSVLLPAFPFALMIAVFCIV